MTFVARILRARSIVIVGALAFGLPQLGCLGNASRATPPTGTPLLPGDPLGVVNPNAPYTGLEGCRTSAITQPGPTFLRRLSSVEYDRTVRDLIGQTTSLSSQLKFPEDPQAAGFSNNAELSIMTQAHAEKYGAAAEILGQKAVESPAQRMLVFGCDPATATDVDRCLREGVERLGRRAFRRDLTASEVGDYVALAAAARPNTDKLAGPRLIVEGMFQSPHFLFQVEVGEVQADKPGRAKLTGYEIAVRLSFFLWGTTPDDALLDLAKAGGLDTAEGVEAAARTMLANGRSKEGLQRFADSWLRLETLARATRDATRFPNFTPSLKDAMAQETRRVVADLMWRPGSNFLDLVTTRSSFVNEELAKHYNIPAPAQRDADGFGSVELPAGSQRAGLLTMASYLTLNAKENRTSPTERGRFVRDVLLCETMPNPPPNIPALPPPPEGGLTRDTVAQHTKDPLCAGCHLRMDPIGFALETYDAIGHYRSSTASGEPIDTRGNVLGFTPSNFEGGVGLGALVREAPAFPLCVAAQTMRFGLNRMDGPEDACTVEHMANAFFSSGYGFQSLLTSLVSSDAFRFRMAEGEG